MLNEILTSPIVHGVVIVVVALVASKWLYKKDEKIEDRRRGAFKLAGELRTKGMTWVPDLLEDYAVGDYDNIGVKLGKIAQLAHNDAAIKDEFKKVLRALLVSHLTDEGAKAELEDMLEGLGHKLTPASPSTSDTFKDVIHSKVEDAIAKMLGGTAAPASDAPAADSKASA